MNLPKAMVTFHLFFTIVSLGSLLLMIGKIVILDWSAFWILVATVFLNAFFGVLWAREIAEKRSPKQVLKLGVERAFPLVSFVVPVHNAEQSILPCLKNIFECAVNYGGPSEVIVIDDGSTDRTFETAWSLIDSEQRIPAHVRSKVVRHTAQLGRIEAVRTGVGKTMGEYIILTDPEKEHDVNWLNRLLEYVSAGERETSRQYAGLTSAFIEKMSETDGLYLARPLRRLLQVG